MELLEIQERLANISNEILFNEQYHSYTVKGNRLCSVSKILEGFTDKPDFKAIARYIDKRDGKAKGETEKAWTAENKKSTDKGHKTHSFAEGEDVHTGEAIATIPEEEAVLKFWAELPTHYKIVQKEVRLYCKSHWYAGTADLPLYNEQTGKVVVVDYKTNKDIYKNYKGKTLLPPFHNLIDCPYNKYQLQLCLYQIMFEQVGLEVEERWLIWLRPDGSYEKIVTHDFTEQLKEWMGGKNFILHY